jgi:hypothetical protein
VEVTQEEALAEARQLFGPGAIVLEERAWGMAEDAVVVVRYVGVRGADPYSWSVLGRGPTWRAALEGARAHEAGLHWKRAGPYDVSR